MIRVPWSFVVASVLSIAWGALGLWVLAAGGDADHELILCILWLVFARLERPR